MTFRLPVALSLPLALTGPAADGTAYITTIAPFTLLRFKSDKLK